MSLVHQLGKQWDFHEDEKTEMIDGKIMPMASPGTRHMTVAGDIFADFKVYFRGSNCRVFYETDVYLTETNRFKPDISVVCSPEIIKLDGIYGAPDLIVEVLSPSTKKRDKTYKKDLYESAGVKEYWIVSVAEMSVEVCLLDEGKYRLDNIYTIIPDWMLPSMNDEERELIKYTFKTHLADDLIIDIERIFKEIM